VIYFGGFFAKLGHFAGFFLYINCRKDQRSCDGRGRVGGINTINMTITELRTALHGFFSKIGISAGFSLYNINFTERDSEAAMAGGRGKIIVLD
jgi:hypothetical protein